MTEIVKSFYKDISYKGKENLKSPKDKESIELAIDYAYRDTQRTLKGVAIQNENKDKAIKDLVNSFQSYFGETAPCKQEDFDKIHKELCSCWVNNLKGDLATYGKAQKIVNMTFKYLLCCKDAQAFNNYFRFCHMPLDSYTLEWLYRNCKDIKRSKISSWSNLAEYGNSDTYAGEDNKEYYTYMFIQKEIRGIIKQINNEFTVLETEFEIWPEMQKHLAIEAFCFAMDQEMSIKEKNEFREMPIDDKINRIKDLLPKITG